MINDSKNINKRTQVKNKIAYIDYITYIINIEMRYLNVFFQLLISQFKTYLTKKLWSKDTMFQLKINICKTTKTIKIISFVYFKQVNLSLLVIQVMKHNNKA